MAWFSHNSRKNSRKPGAKKSSAQGGSAGCQGAAKPGDEELAKGLTPTEAVTEAIGRGISSRADIARLTGLRPETVGLILDRMERTGRLRREALGSMCGGGGCSTCEHASPAGGCASATMTGASRGPVSLVLRRRPH